MKYTDKLKLVINVSRIQHLTGPRTVQNLPEKKKQKRIIQIILRKTK